MGVVLLTLTVLLLLSSYDLLETARKALIVTQRGAEVKAYPAAAQAVSFLRVVQIYRRLGAAFGA